MSNNKLTTRLPNQNIIDTARQQYENTQRSKLPSIVIDLPSKGLIYPEDSILREGKVEMRYMTAYDEDIITNASYLQNGILFEKLIDAVLLTPIKSKDIASSDRDMLIVYSRILAYGSDYPVSIEDPKTKTVLDRIVDLTKLAQKPFDLVSDKNGEFEYKINDDVTLKFAYNSKIEENATVSQILKRIIRQVGTTRSESDIEHFIRYEFLASDAKEFRTFYIKNAPGINYEYDFEGEDGGTFKSRFQIGADIFWF
jgi:hypothetical protein